MLQTRILSLLLILCSAIFVSCKEDDDDDKTEAPTESEVTPQEQFFSQDVQAGKPFVLIYGDSISTGVLANTELGANIDNGLALQLGDYVKGGTYNAANFQADLANQDLAASTTDQDYGFRAAAAARLGVTAKEVGVVSLAKFGGRSQDLKGMLARWEQEETETIQSKPNYVLVMLGGNDFCSDNSVENIRQNFEEEISAVYRNSPDSIFVIAPAPPAYRLAAIDFTYGPTLTEISGEEMSCRKFREQSCKNVYLPDAQARLEGINAGIKAAYDSISSQGAKAVFVEAVADWDIQASDLSFDCFHPSAAGQAKIGAFIQDALTASGL